MIINFVYTCVSIELNWLVNQEIKLSVHMVILTTAHAQLTRGRQEH